MDLGQMIKKDWLIPGALGLAAGLVVGFIVGDNFRYRKLQAKLEEVSEDAVGLNVQSGENLQKLSSLVQQADMVVTKFNHRGAQFIADYAEAHRAEIESVAKPMSDDEEEIPDPEEEDEVEWDWEAETAKRSPAAPYIIHEDEWDENLDERTQVHITYYAADQVLVDELDQPIYGAEKIVGTLEFGRGSSDPLMVYICNEQLDVMYAVSKDPGSYQVEVLGAQIETELEHRNRHHELPKFRMD